MPTKTLDAPPGATADDRRFLDRHASEHTRSSLRATWTDDFDTREDG